MPEFPSPLVALADLPTLGPVLVDRLASAWRGGLGWICLRAPGAATEERVGLGRQALARCPGLFLTVHGDPEACEELGAPGLHLPSRGFDVGALRRRFPSVVLGVSCHGRAELEGAQAAGADYAFLSPLFPPSSKPLVGAALGAEGFRRAVRGLSLPVLALGGVTPERLAAARAAGARGAAALGTLFLAGDVETRARRYREEAGRLWP
ncbi:MAG: thiamine phosphate synthase [Deferrisomatales bacterium]